MPDTNGSQFQIGSSNTNNTPFAPKIASFNNNQSVIVWYKANNAGYYQSYFQLVDSNGQKIGSETTVGYRGNTANQYNTNVAILNNNNFIVTWLDQPGDYIYAQIFDSQGNQVTSPFRFQLNGYLSQPLGLPNGNAVVVWDKPGGTTGDVYLQIIDNSGNFISSVIKVNPISYPNNYQLFPNIALLDNGQFIVTWINYGSDNSVIGLYGQIFNSDGTKQGTNFKINTYTSISGNQFVSPALTKLSNGNIVVFWNSGAPQYVYQLLSNTGTKIGNEQFIDINYLDSGVSVQSLGNGFACFLSGATDNTVANMNVYGQLFANDGSVIGNQFLANQDPIVSKRFPAATISTNGDFVVVWADRQTDINSVNTYSVQGQRFYGALTATNTVQTINYTEDDATVSLNSIVIRSPIDTLTVSLKLSDAAAGRLTTATANNVTSTYTAATGTWQASGAKADVNTLLANLQFIPAANYNGNFTITLNINDGFSTPINGTISAIGTPVNDIPVLVNNKLTISQGQTLVLTSSNLSATDVDNATNTLTFTVSNVQNGRFELVSNPGIAITTFIQQQITDRQVQFVHNGGGVAPAYKVTVSDGSLTTTPAAATITYNAAPVLVNNQLTINQGQTLVLTSTNLSATDADNTSGSLTFTVSNVQHGRFELLSNPGVAINSFTQQQITNGQIRFVQDNSTSKPDYQVSVSDGIVATPAESASVLFNMAPVLVNNQLVINEGQTLVLTTDNLSATDGDNANSSLTFIISSVTHGRFEFSSNPGNSITSFTQQQIINGQVQFVHDGSEVAPTYKVSVSDGSASTPIVTGQISFTNINDMPVLVNNQLSINPGQTLILSSNNLSATDSDNISSTLVFTVSAVQHGQFELAANPGIAVTSFTQQQLVTGQVQFVHDGSNQAPAYLVSVSDGALETTPVAASIQFALTPIAAPLAVTPNGEPAAHSPSVSPMGITPMSNEPISSNPVTNTPSANSPQGETMPQMQVSSAASLSTGWISPATWLISSTQQAMRTLLSTETTTASKGRASYQAGSDTQHDIGYSPVYSANSMMNNLPNQLMLLKVGIHWGQQAWQWLTQSSPKSSVHTSFEVESNKLMQEIKQLKVTLAQAERYQSALYVKNAEVAEQYDLALETHAETLNVIAQQGKADVVTLDTLKTDVAYLFNALKAEYKAYTSSSQATASQISFFQPSVSSTKQTNFSEVSLATTHLNVVAADETQIRCLLSK